MKLLKEITEQSLGVEPMGEIIGRSYQFKKSVRSLLLNDKNEISLQYVTSHDYYKLTGGGIDIGETNEEALKRETREEAGCDSSIIDELGMTIEYRNQEDLLHITYGYLTKVVGEIGEPQYEPSEMEDEYKAVWMPIDEAIDIMSKSLIQDTYKGKFIVARELIFLQEAKKRLDEVQ